MNDQDLLRYSRHILLPQIDLDGQQALLDSHAMIIGLGGLGCPVAMYLAAAGVGKITLVDHDRVEVSNLQRQIAHTDADVGRFKVESAAETLRQLNPAIEICCVTEKATLEWLTAELPEVDVLLDCTDNSSIRYQMNDACIATRTPWVSAAATGWAGQLLVFDARQANTPCYRCLYPQLGTDPAGCAESGVAAPLVGVIGSLQAMEALKLLTGAGKAPLGRLMTYDALHSDWQSWQLNVDPGCQSCQGLSSRQAD
ncbi:HesA/MoeB/ThiF family protein [Oceanobacter mangrovi]|uniref:HesA/MoeB/ThiF family protein n=1 Tax=Oceanobacter mangrovi TaxID=2862510 RepID=UPI001C8D7E05|nr:HesA/MoeB/ThiF family protein [Oceanobacter mangrovi]